MSGLEQSAHWRATWMLVLATAFWALSFPAMKSLVMVQQELLPGSTTWFFSSYSIGMRFGIAAVLLFFVSLRTLRQLTWLEFWEGFGLGFFGGAGLIFQMDGLAYTLASVSAFLTQFYCLVIPLLVAVWERKWPAPVVLLSSVMVLAGVAVLAEFDWRQLRMGRGEWETLVGSVIFAGQILWLQRREFGVNRVTHFTLVMFGVIGVLSFGVSVLTAEKASDWVFAYASGAAWGLMGVLVIFCTLGGYLLMNRWQPFVTATQAGLIYCAEPVFASLFALFLPGLISDLGGINYANERVGLNLLTGGILITVANVLIQLQPAQPKSEKLASQGPVQ